MKHLHISFALILICTFGLSISTSQPVKGKSTTRKCVLPADDGDFPAFLKCVEKEQGLGKDFKLVQNKVKGLVHTENSKSKRFFHQIESSLKSIQIFFEKLIAALLKPGPDGPGPDIPDNNGSIEGGGEGGEGGEDRKMKKKKKKNVHN